MRIRLPLLPTWLRWAAVVVVAALIFYVSVITVPPETVIDRGRPDIIPLDKWRHFVAYAAFGGSLAYATTDWRVDVRWLAIGVVGVAVVYGVGIEFSQAVLPARYYSLGDAYANALGGLLVIPYYGLIRYVEFVPVRDWLGSVTADAS